MARKGAVVFLGLTGVTLGILALSRLARAAPPGEAAVTIKFYPVGSRIPLGAPGPANLVEGSTYTMKVSVTNKSAKLGAFIPATLDVAYLAATPKRVFVAAVRVSRAFGANETVTFTSPAFTVPSAAVGEVGESLAQVFTPGVTSPLAEVFEGIYVVAAPISYAATVGIMF